ncbi:hypothetical protein ACVW00_001012 [Marmoricola sp. URHA0025 HA25]
MRQRRKIDVVRNVAILLGAEPPPMSTGSTEPREIFVIVNDRLGLGIRSNATKQEMARRIVQASGRVWAPDYESRGATITREGLEAVESAVRFFLGLPEATQPAVPRSSDETRSSSVPRSRRLTGITLHDYLSPNRQRLTANWLDLLDRTWSGSKRQATFTPVETVLCQAASLRVRHNAFGGGSAEQAPTPVPELAALFKRPASSILAKMANLDGTRPNGGQFDAEVGQTLGSDLSQLAHVYRHVLEAARDCGIDATVLPDFLGCEVAGTPRRPIDY